jgi:hypothetical protein
LVPVIDSMIGLRMTFLFVNHESLATKPQLVAKHGAITVGHTVGS